MVVNLRLLKYEKSDKSWLAHCPKSSSVPRVVKNRPSVSETSELAKWGGMRGDTDEKWGEKVGTHGMKEETNALVKRAEMHSGMGPERLAEDKVVKWGETGQERLGENGTPAQDEEHMAGKLGEMLLAKGMETGLGRLAENGVEQDENRENVGAPCHQGASLCHGRVFPQYLHWLMLRLRVR